MIDREQVLHVARLARLQLDEQQVQRMASELSGVLAHVDRIAALELEGVAPTSHVAQLTGALRADRQAASLEREQAFAQAPSSDGESFLVPSPQA